MKYLIIILLLSSCCIHFHQKEKIVEKGCPPCSGLPLYYPIGTLPYGLKYDTLLERLDGMWIRGGSSGLVIPSDTLK